MNCNRTMTLYYTLKDRGEPLKRSLRGFNRAALLELADRLRRLVGVLERRAVKLESVEVNSTRRVLWPMKFKVGQDVEWGTSRTIRGRVERIKLGLLWDKKDGYRVHYRYICRSEHGKIEEFAEWTGFEVTLNRLRRRKDG